MFFSLICYRKTQVNQTNRGVIWFGCHSAGARTTFATGAGSGLRDVWSVRVAIDDGCRTGAVGFIAAERTAPDCSATDGRVPAEQFQGLFRRARLSCDSGDPRAEGIEVDSRGSFGRPWKAQQLLAACEVADLAWPREERGGRVCKSRYQRVL